MALPICSHGIVGLEFISKICSRKDDGSQLLLFFETKQERSSSEHQHLEEGLHILACLSGQHYTNIDIQTNTNAHTNNNTLLILIPTLNPISLNANTINTNTSISDTNTIY